MGIQSNGCVLALAAACCLAPACQTSSAEAEKLWELAGFATPESVLPDPATGILYVSNVAGNLTDKDGNGFISKVSADGKMLTLDWVTGLNGPKGLALANGRLYVADIDRLVEIDPEAGKVVASYPADQAKFLNDVAAGSDGAVYVSDTATNTIWRLAKLKFEPWLVSADLNGPNGLVIQGDRLIVSAWGVMAENGKPGVPASLLEVSLDDKSVQPLGDGRPVGNLDGLEPEDDDDFLVTDWVAGGLFRIEDSGEAEKILALPSGSADLGYVAATKTAIIPLMKDNKVEAYKVD